MNDLKTATFTVHANVEQSARWKQSAEAAGYRSTGVWLAHAADAYMKVRARAGAPIPLAWHRAHFEVILDDGKKVKMYGKASPPFGIYRGTGEGKKAYAGSKAYSVVFLPDARIIATVRTTIQARSLAAELAGPLLKGFPSVEPGGIIERAKREAV